MVRSRIVAGEIADELTMYWQESEQTERYIVPDDIIDAVYSITCRCLPVDHAYALMRAVQQALPWLAGEEAAGIHPIYVADSGNGWMRPDGPDDLLYLSRRTKLVIRLPKHRVEDAAELVGRTLDVAGNALRVEKVATRPLSTMTTVFSRYVVIGDAPDESAFMVQALEQLRVMGITPKKMLGGIERIIGMSGGSLRTRSLMLADLSVAESVTLQRRGLGPLRQLGCGLFIPHKDIKQVPRPEE